MIKRATYKLTKKSSCRLVLMLAAITLSLASCNEEQDSTGNENIPMMFTCSTAEHTRATTYGDYTGGNFGVQATNYTGNYTSTTGKVHMDNVEVTYSDGTCSTAIDYFWPDGDMHFAAYSPYVEDPSTSDMQVTLPQKPYAGYSYNGKVEGRTNLMFANEQYGSLVGKFTTGSVPIQFNHALTKVQFQARMADGTPSNVSLKINSMYVRNVRIKGSATFTHNGKSGYASVSPTDDANKWNTDGMKWTVSKEFPAGSTYDANYLGDHQVTCTGMSGIGTTFTVFNDCFYLMPQQLYTTGESQFVQTLEVNYTIVTNAVEGQPKTVSVPLKTSNIPAWTVNKAVMYNLVVETGESLSLTAAVQPWKKEEFTNEFSDIVTVNADGKIIWTPGTCTVIDENVVLDNNISNAAEFTFTIAGPLGGTWQAIFVTQEGNPTAFSLSQSEGEVGKPCTVRVSANQVNNTKTANVAELRFVVRCAGAILPVYELTTLSGERNYKIVQNISLN